MKEMERNEASDELAHLLRKAKGGDEAATNKLLEMLQREMIKVARGMMQSERPGHTLQATALVNEACMRLIQGNTINASENQRYLLAAANRSMQQILVEHARSRNRLKRGGKHERISLDEALDCFEAENGVQFEDLHEALGKLGKQFPRQCELIEHRYFGGLSIEDASQLMNISTATAIRDWRFARAWLKNELNI